MCFSPYLGVGGVTKGSRAHNLLMQFSGLGSSKMEISESDFFDTLTIQNDQISYVKHVLDPLHVFFTLFGCGAGGGGGTKGSRAHNLLMQFSGLGSSQMEISESDFFDTLTIQNDQISYVLAPLPSSRCLAEGNRIFWAQRAGENHETWDVPKHGSSCLIE